MNHFFNLFYKKAVAFFLAATLTASCVVTAHAESTSLPASGKLNSAYDARTAASTQSTTAAETDGHADETAATKAQLAQTNENDALDEQEAVETSSQLNADGTPNISAASAVIMDCDTGMVLYGLNENDQRPMASTTKIMTCILALESGDIGRTVTVTEDCMEMLDGTKIGLKVGDKITMHDLCVAMMMYSGNDAANTAAVAVGGSLANFVSMMNQKAAELGMLNTHFDTPSGLDQFSDGAHYSSAYDMALLGKYAMQNADFRTIVGFRVRSIYWDEYPKGKDLYTHNYLMEGQQYGYEGCDGIKTGVTNLAGQCLVSHVTTKEGLHLVCVTLNNLNRWHDHRVLYNYAKSLYEQMAVDKDISEFNATVVGGRQSQIAVKCEPAETFNVLKTQKEDVKKQIVYDQFIYAPISEGDVVGQLQYTVNGSVIVSYPITATENIEASTNGWFTDYINAIRTRQR